MIFAASSSLSRFPNLMSFSIGISTQTTNIKPESIENVQNKIDLDAILNLPKCSNKAKEITAKATKLKLTIKPLNKRFW